MIPLIYIAGPFRGPTPLDVRRNVENARDFGMLVAEQGGYPMIPHTMTADFDKQLDDQFWLDGTMEMLRRCDGIACLGHWQTSRGARAEMEWATSAGMLWYEHPSAHGALRVGLAELAIYIEGVKALMRQRRV